MFYNYYIIITLSRTNDDLMLASNSENVCTLKVCFITKGPEDRILPVEQIEHCVEFSNPPLVHDEDTIVVGLVQVRQDITSREAETYRWY